MIRYTTGDLLEAPTEAIVNTVNEIGTSGKGLALQFRNTFPAETHAYESAAKSGQVHVGRMFVFERNAPAGPRWIISFPTKKHWRNPSQMAWVQDGLVDLARVIREHDIRSLAIPPLGCGLGGLRWDDVRPEIEKALADLSNVEILVYEPA